MKIVILNEIQYDIGINIWNIKHLIIFYVIIIMSTSHVFKYSYMDYFTIQLMHF